MGLGIDNPLPPVAQWVAALQNPFTRSPAWGYSIDKWGPPGLTSQAQRSFTMAQITAAPQGIRRSGRWALDTDGTGPHYGDPNHRDSASAMANSRGQFMPRRDDLVGRNGYRDLNSDEDSYVAAPSKMAASIGGRLHVGDRATVMVNGRTAETRLGDFATGGRQVEGSLALNRELGLRAVVVPGHGPLPSVNGITTPNMRATVIYYPGTYLDQ
jgi:hypothetical protein